VQTKLCPDSRLKDLYQYLYDGAQRGVQTFIVCARVEESDADELGLQSAKALYARLSRTKLARVGLGLLYGKQSEKDKTAVMQAFADGTLKVLVTTTVVEVGIDVPAANIMVIFDADRYGLAQLHQLRGRVGRHREGAYTFLVTHSTAPEAMERLKMLQTTTSGFALSEYDLKVRGAGDFIGVRQHGMSGSLAGLPLSRELVEEAKEIVSEINEVYGYDRDYYLTHFLRESYAAHVRKVVLN
jgi:ATP-dependent DNA helicase RecG